jgi:hypothetical protein
MSDPDDDLTLRPTLIGGDRFPDDYEVIWRGIAIGRILIQPGVPVGRANWFWGVSFPGRPQPTSHRGNNTDLEDCKRRFKAVWSGIRSGLSDADIEAARRIEADADRRFKKWPER